MDPDGEKAEPLAAQVGRVAETQYGLVTLSQARELGLSHHQVHHLVASARWVRMAPRVFLVNGAPLPWQGRVLAEVLCAGQDAVASRRTAGELWELDGFDPTRTVHLTLPRGRRPKPRSTVRLHLVQDFAHVAPTTRQGVPVTGIERTLLDLYRSEPNLEVARRGLFSARKQKLVTWTSLSGCVDSHDRPGARGIRRLRADIDLYWRGGCPESNFEDSIRALLTGAGLPEPQLQYWVTAGGSRYRLDAAYPECKVGIEGRSKLAHFSDEAFEKDPLRDADLALAGWIILHITWAHLRDDPAGVLRRVRRALESRAGLAV